MNMQTKCLKHSSNFESVENVRCSNIVKFKFELCHIFSEKLLKVNCYLLLSMQLVISCVMFT